MFKKKVYNKLVRDKIPEIITEKGDVCEVKKADKNERIIKLLDKMIEEAAEAREAGCEAYLYSQEICADSATFNVMKDRLTEEFADLLEVLNSIADWYNIQPKKIEEARIKKLKERGGFENGTILKWVQKQ